MSLFFQLERFILSLAVIEKTKPGTFIFKALFNLIDFYKYTFFVIFNMINFFSFSYLQLLNVM